MKGYAGTTPEVDAISAIDLSGNMTPPNWYQHIRYTNKRGTYTDHLAIAILSDIVYWYRRIDARDEASGQQVGWNRKFKADLLQRSYEAYVVLMGSTLKQVKAAFRLLEELTLLRLHFRHIKASEGKPMSNVMYIQPVPESIASITHRIDAEDLKRQHRDRKNKVLTHMTEMGQMDLTEMGETYTETTDTEISKENTLNASDKALLMRFRENAHSAPTSEEKEQDSQTALATHPLPVNPNPIESSSEKSLSTASRIKSSDILPKKKNSKEPVLTYDDRGWLKLPKEKRWHLQSALAIGRLQRVVGLAVLSDDRGFDFCYDDDGEFERSEDDQLMIKLSKDGDELPEREAMENGNTQLRPLMEYAVTFGDATQNDLNDWLKQLFTASIEWCKRMGDEAADRVKQSWIDLFYKDDCEMLGLACELA